MDRYSLRLLDSNAGIVEVRFIPHLPPGCGEFTYKLPAWIPGSYKIRDFARNFIKMGAIADGHPVDVELQGKSSWRVTWNASEIEQLEICYQSLARDLSVRGCYLDPQKALINGAALFVQRVDGENQPIELEIERICLPECGETNLYTSLSAYKVDHSGFGSYRAEHYDDLIDAPVLIGAGVELRFMVQGKPHAAVFVGVDQVNDVIADDLARICEEQAKLFGGLPVSDYQFLTLAVGEGYGGLEHANSCTLMCSVKDLPIYAEGRHTKKNYQKFLGLCSHEYFHLWNVKRIRPEVYHRPDLSQEVYTKLLWWFEGVTSYYDDLILLRSGVIQLSDYLQILAENITAWLRIAGKHRQSLQEASYLAWTNLYQQDQNSHNYIISYYGKGALLAFCLDIYLREKSDSREHLDMILRYLWHCTQSDRVKIDDEHFIDWLDSVGQVPLADWLRPYVSEPGDLPFEKALGRLGVFCRVGQRRSATDLGGLLESPMPTVSKATVSPGWEGNETASGLLLAKVYQGQSAEKAGLQPGDELIALNGMKLDKEYLEYFLGESIPEDRWHIHYFRQGVLKTTELILQCERADTCFLYLLTDCADETERFRRLWASPQ